MVDGRGKDRRVEEWGVGVVIPHECDINWMEKCTISKYYELIIYNESISVSYSGGWRYGHWFLSGQFGPDIQFLMSWLF